MKKLLLLALALCLLVALPACSSSSTPEAQSPSSSPAPAAAPDKPQLSESAIQITAEELLTAYEDNEVAADANYKGEILLVTGVVDSIGKDLFDTPYVTLTDGSDFAIFSVQCYFKKSDEGELAKITKGQTVTIQGECDGKTLNIGLDDSSIVMATPMESAPPATTEPSAPASPETAMEVSAADLCAAYEENEVAADAKYKGKLLEITGEITSIGVDLMDKSYVTLSDGSQFSIMGVQCFFSASEQGELAKLSKGQTVTIKGTSDGYMLNVHVKNCTVVSAGPSSAPAAAPAASSGETVEVSSKELYEAYNENQVAANAVYKDKKLIVTGTITDIGIVDILEIPYVNLKGDASGILGVQCLFSKSDEAALAGLSNGQEVTIEGEFLNFTVMVGLDNCSLVK